MVKFPILSVVMSVYNAEKYLNECIGSILNQTFSDFEFIIINDGSTDSSLEIINSYSDKRIKIINQSNRGLSKSLNRGIRVAKGKYISRIDADDIAMSNRFELQLDFLTNNSEYVIVGSNAEIIDKDGRILYKSNLSINDEQISMILPNSPFFHSSTTYLKTVFIKCGGYNEEVFHHFEDRILWNKMSKFGKLYNLNDSLIQYRLVPESISNRDKKSNEVLNEICNQIVNNDQVSNKQIELISSIRKNESFSRRMANYYFRIGKIYLEENFQRSKAIHHLFKSLNYFPFDYFVWFNLVLSLLPKSIIKKWKNYRKKLILC